LGETLGRFATGYDARAWASLLLCEDIDTQQPTPIVRRHRGVQLEAARPHRTGAARGRCRDGRGPLSVPPRGGAAPGAKTTRRAKRV